MNTKTLKEFWKELSLQERDLLRQRLSEALFVTTNTIDAYGCSARSVPWQKQGKFQQIVAEHHQVDITF